MHDRSKMISLPDKELIVFDLEYTQPKPWEVPEIWEIAGLRVNREFLVIDQFYSLVKPTNFEGLCTDDATTAQLEKARSWQDVWRDWAKFTRFNSMKLASWHAYNDHRVLMGMYDRLNYGYPHNHFILDIASMYYFLSGYLGLRTTWGLGEVCNRLHISYNRNHRALPDAIAALQVLRTLYCFEELVLGKSISEGQADEVRNSIRSEGDAV